MSGCLLQYIQNSLKTPLTPHLAYIVIPHLFDFIGKHWLIGTQDLVRICSSMDWHSSCCIFWQFPKQEFMMGRTLCKRLKSGSPVFVISLLLLNWKNCLMVLNYFMVIISLTEEHPVNCDQYILYCRYFKTSINIIMPINYWISLSSVLNSFAWYLYWIKITLFRNIFV